MKRGIVLVVMMILVIACDDKGDDDRNSATLAKIAEAKTIATDGPWVITYFWDTDKDETAGFSGTVFDFASNGTLTATKGATIVVGEWSATAADSGDDNPDDDVDFNIVFLSPADFEELSEDWSILSISPSKIELKHVSGGNGGTDFLTFEKN